MKNSQSTKLFYRYIYRAILSEEIDSVVSACDQWPECVRFHDNNFGIPPIMLAALRNRLDIVRLLIARGANINQTDNSKNTTLMISCITGAIYITQELLRLEADPSSKNIDGKTALDYAIQGNQLILIAILTNRIQKKPPHFDSLTERMP